MRSVYVYMNIYKYAINEAVGDWIDGVWIGAILLRVRSPDCAGLTMCWNFIVFLYLSLRFTHYINKYDNHYIRRKLWDIITAKCVSMDAISYIYIT